MIEKFDELYADAQKFENDPSHDIRDRNPIYITWIGFLLDEAYHRYMKEFTYDNKLQTRFLLSPAGEPLGEAFFQCEIRLVFACLCMFWGLFHIRSSRGLVTTSCFVVFCTRRPKELCMHMFALSVFEKFLRE